MPPKRSVSKGKGVELPGPAPEETASTKHRPSESIQQSPRRSRKEQPLSVVVSPSSRMTDENMERSSTPTTKNGGRKETTTVVTPQMSDAKKVESSSPFQSKIPINNRVKKVYKILNKCTGALGGNGSTGAIYGELTMGSMQRVVNTLVEECEMTSASRFIDVGSGLGKPNFHVSQDPATRVSIGIELEEIRWKLAIHNLNGVLTAVSDATEAALPRLVEEDEDRENSSERSNGAKVKATKSIPTNLKLFGGVNFLVGDIDAATTFDPFTHVYMFDLGFPPSLQQSIAKKFNTSAYAKYLVSYRPPLRVVEEYGFDVELVKQLSTSMHGSGENHTAYFYRRLNFPVSTAPATVGSNHVKITFPKRLGMSPEEEDLVDVLCDKVFAGPVGLAAGNLTALREHVRDLTDIHQQKGRPVRERKQSAK